MDLDELDKYLSKKLPKSKMSREKDRALIRLIKEEAGGQEEKPGLFTFNFIMKRVAVGVCAIVILFGGLGAYAYNSDNVTVDKKLYGFKTFIENYNIKKADNPFEKVKIYSTLAQRKLNEAEILAQRNGTKISFELIKSAHATETDTPTPLTRTIKAYEENNDKALVNIEEITKPEEIKIALNFLNQAHQTQEQKLEKIAKKVGLKASDQVVISVAFALEETKTYTARIQKTEELVEQTLITSQEQGQTPTSLRVKLRIDSAPKNEFNISTDALKNQISTKLALISEDVDELKNILELTDELSEDEEKTINLMKKIINETEEAIQEEQMGRAKRLIKTTASIKNNLLAFKEDVPKAYTIEPEPMQIAYNDSQTDYQEAGPDVAKSEMPVPSAEIETNLTEGFVEKPTTVIRIPKTIITFDEPVVMLPPLPTQIARIPTATSSSRGGGVGGVAAPTTSMVAPDSQPQPEIVETLPDLIITSVYQVNNQLRVKVKNAGQKTIGINNAVSIQVKLIDQSTGDYYYGSTLTILDINEEITIYPNVTSNMTGSRNISAVVDYNSIVYESNEYNNQKSENIDFAPEKIYLYINPDQSSKTYNVNETATLASFSFQAYESKVYANNLTISSSLSDWHNYIEDINLYINSDPAPASRGTINGNTIVFSAFYVPINIGQTTTMTVKARVLNGNRSFNFEILNQHSIGFTSESGEGIAPGFYNSWPRRSGLINFTAPEPEINPKLEISVPTTSPSSQNLYPGDKMKKVAIINFTARNDDIYIKQFQPHKDRIVQYEDIDRVYVYHNGR